MSPGRNSGISTFMDASWTGRRQQRCECFSLLFTHSKHCQFRQQGLSTSHDHACSHAHPRWAHILRCLLRLLLTTHPHTRTHPLPSSNSQRFLRRFCPVDVLSLSRMPTPKTTFSPPAPISRTCLFATVRGSTISSRTESGSDQNGVGTTLS